MTKEEYKEASEYWQKKDAAGMSGEHAAVKAAAEAYVLSRNTCALATGAGDFVRCTPIEYTYHDGAFWMFTEGGQKFTGLAGNSHVCLAVFDPYSGFGKLKGLQIMGQAEAVEPFSAEYNQAAAFRKIPLEALQKLPSPMHLLKIVPSEADFLDSDFKEQNLSARQHFIW